LGDDSQKDFVFSLERRMTPWFSKKPDTKTITTKDSGNGWGIGIAVMVIILLFILCFGIWGTCTDSGKSTFANIKTKLSLPGGNGSLKDLDIIMFMSPTCPWCKKMMGVLDSEGQLNNITVVDINKPEGAAMAQQYGADKQPVPSFISRKLKSGTVGYRDSVSKLMDALKQQPQVSNDSSSEEPTNGGGGGAIGNTIRDLQIVLFAREGCIHCQRAKEACSQAGIIDQIQVIDITTPEGQSMASNLLPPGTAGVPVWISLVTKKHIVGFKELGEVIQSLR
jgi:glutaredoxin